jgi:hypothetical protein
MRTAPPPRGEVHTSSPFAWPPDDRQLVLSLLRDYIERPAAGRLRALLFREFHDLTDLWSQGLPAGAVACNKENRPDAQDQR